MKRAYRISHENIYGELYLDAAGQYLHYIHENDARYRPEYMDPIIEFFGGEIIDIEINWDKVTGLEDATYGEEFVDVLHKPIQSFIKKYEKKRDKNREAD